MTHSTPLINPNSSKKTQEFNFQKIFLIKKFKFRKARSTSILPCTTFCILQAYFAEKWHFAYCQKVAICLFCKNGHTLVISQAILLWDTVGVLVGIGPILFCVLVHIRYQFKQINRDFNEGIRWGDIHLIHKAITNHNFVSIRVNKTLCKLIYIFNKIGKQVINLMLFISMSPGTDFYTSLIFLFIVIIILIGFMMINVFSASIISEAHRSQRILYYFVATHRIRSQLNKLKIIAFIEKLSGPEIGFYCWNLFPMTKL